MDWHRLFGLILTDFFSDSPFIVELEKDLSLKKQLLDVVILRRLSGSFTGRLPDGLEDLADRNLISFKSYQETLDDWALKELIGHYVNYRKQVSPSWTQLVPEAAIRLFAVCARYPHKLASRVPLEERQPGVYRCQWGTDEIRVVVLRQLPQVDHNALWHLFSAAPVQVGYGAQHYRPRSEQTSTLLDQLFERYQREGIAMPYTMEDFRHDYVKEHISQLTFEERLEGVPVEERLKGVPVEERLKSVPAEERLKGLSAKEIEDLLKRLTNGRSAAPE